MTNNGMRRYCMTSIAAAGEVWAADPELSRQYWCVDVAYCSLLATSQEGSQPAVLPVRLERYFPGALWCLLCTVQLEGSDRADILQLRGVHCWSLMQSCAAAALEWCFAEMRR